MFKWDWKKKKKEIEKWVPHMPAPCSLLWFYKKMVGRMEPRQTYYIFYILIPKSVLLLLSIVPVCLMTST